MLKKAYRELFSASPTVEDLIARELPDESTRFVVRWGILRPISEQSPSWPDGFFRRHCPDVTLARWLAADPLVPTLARVATGKVAQFENLPENGTFRFGDTALEVRWRLLACLLTLAELRVIGAQFLSPDVVEHMAQLPDVQAAVESQFRHLTIDADAEGVAWVLRVTCDEPVLDYAIADIARQLDSELRSVRARVSDYLSRVLRGRGFPIVRADPQPRLADGRPRYTTPHISFAMAPDHARRLFMGTDLWGDPSFVYRELFQNALDACRYRAARPVPCHPLCSKYPNVPRALGMGASTSSARTTALAWIAISSLLASPRRVAASPRPRSFGVKWTRGEKRVSISIRTVSLG